MNSVIVLRTAYKNKKKIHLNGFCYTHLVTKFTNKDYFAALQLGVRKLLRAKNKHI